MPRKVIQQFPVEYMQILDEDGNLDKNLAPDITEDTLKVMYHMMTLVRTFDRKLFNLQRSGKIGTYAEVRGEEGSEVGSGLAMEKTDWMVPSFRETGVSLTRGADRVKVVLAWNGDCRGYLGEHGKARDLPVNIPIGTQLLHAAGIAWACKLKGEKNAVVTYCGDGGTSEGDFHEALNFAGVYKLPVIFMVQNNQWAISTPRKVQTAAETIAQKAIGYGIKGIQIDGNDVVGVYYAVKEALARAKNGEGATLIESVTYRMGDHTTSDDASRYRTDEEVKPWEKKDPILRLKLYLQKNGMWTDEYGKWVQDECDKEVNEAVDKALSTPLPPPEDLFRYIYEKPTQDLEEQEKDHLDALKEDVK